MHWDRWKLPPTSLVACNALNTWNLLLISCCLNPGQHESEPGSLIAVRLIPRGFAARSSIALAKLLAAKCFNPFRRIYIVGLYRSVEVSQKLQWEELKTAAGLSTSWSQTRSRHGRISRHEDRKPSEVFRTDLITAMKLHDSHQLNPEDYYVLADPWRQDWEKGVQVPVNSEFILEPVARFLGGFLVVCEHDHTDLFTVQVSWWFLGGFLVVCEHDHTDLFTVQVSWWAIAETDKVVTYTRPRKYIHSSGSDPPELGYVDIHTLADGVCRYDLNEMDVAWLEMINEEFKDMGMPQLDEYVMERVMEEFEQRCYDNMNHAIETEEGLGIEYDEDVVCDVCQSPDGEDGNEMVFCDKCNICVHQDKGSMLWHIESARRKLAVPDLCLRGTAKVFIVSEERRGYEAHTQWHQVSIGSPEKMEPITKVSHIPSSRWALLCNLCNDKFGACIQVTQQGSKG
ncbi:unnamed protein product [Ranitomeya imitator]|uniref:PHD-type domain-containing protein n=1 Tax=Ranitomeya imitator TaxID=111125 RepID=A0ABN9LIR8_9NEOB|nr:unnamed protein product [Ranitomeya imitator]